MALKSQCIKNKQTHKVAAVHEGSIQNKYPHALVQPLTQAFLVESYFL